MTGAGIVDCAIMRRLTLEGSRVPIIKKPNDGHTMPAS